MEKIPLLFLCHRIPFPPNKGDKIRSYHLLEHLSHHFDIYLASFVDDPQDWDYADKLNEYCKDFLLRPLSSTRGLLRSMRGLVSGQALSIPYYADGPLQAWVNEQVSTRGIRHAIVYSSSMAQFLPRQGRGFDRKVIDFVDVDSDKWAQYARQKSPPLSWLYRREARSLLQLEQKLAADFDAGLFVSSSEADLFHELSPETAHKIGFYNNGVDSTYFDPGYIVETGVENPFQENELALVFTGAMDYWPNVDAVDWFAREVLPSLRQDNPAITLTIVGGNPTRSVQKLQSLDGVSVTGRVPDVRPYLKYALAAVAPMRIARGVQNKVLEGMSMQLPVLVSQKGLEGIDADHGREVLLVETEKDYRREVGQLLAGEYSGLGERARSHVQKAFNWEENLPEVVFLLGQDDAVPQYARAHISG